MRRLGLVTTLLVTFGLVQIAFRQAWVPPRLSGLVPQDSVPATAVTMLGDGSEAALSSLTARSPGCDVVFLMSAYCPQCARMRHTWQSRYRTWADSVGRPVSVIWVVRQSRSIAEEFVEGFDLEPVLLTSLAGDARSSWRRLGVIGTPMAYLVDRAGRVRSGVMGPSFPPAAEAEAVCRPG